MPEDLNIVQLSARISTCPHDGSIVYNDAAEVDWPPKEFMQQDEYTFKITIISAEYDSSLE